MIPFFILIGVLAVIIVVMFVREQLLKTDLAKAQIDARTSWHLGRALDQAQDQYWSECQDSYNWQSRCIGANAQKKGWEKKARRRKLIIEQLDVERHKLLNQLNFMTNSYETLVDAIHQRAVIKTEGDVLGQLSSAVQLLDAVHAGDVVLSLPIKEEAPAVSGERL